MSMLSHMSKGIANWIGVQEIAVVQYNADSRESPLWSEKSNVREESDNNSYT